MIFMLGEENVEEAFCLIFLIIPIPFIALVIFSLI